MAHPYVLIGRELELVLGTLAGKKLTELKPPAPPIRALPLPRVLFPALKQGG